MTVVINFEINVTLVYLDYVMFIGNKYSGATAILFNNNYFFIYWGYSSGLLLRSNFETILLTTPTYLTYLTALASGHCKKHHYHCLQKLRI